jgi:MinD superfamily P-loop ATPase
VKEITVISGKGGTGKTSIVASFAALTGDAVLADCDVDAADLHLILDPKILEQHEFRGGKKAEIISEKCGNCGDCLALCRFSAITRKLNNATSENNYVINPISCEGCGICAWFCPDKAIEFKEAVNGTWFISNTRYGPMVHAKLGIAEENSGKLVTLVRNNAKKIAEKENRQIIIVDGSPGIGCPVIASITGADLVLIVTEPTLSGEHDLERVTKLAQHFKIPAVICINKSDLNPEISKRIAKNARAKGYPSIGNIRYDKMVTKAQMAKAAVVEYTNLPIKDDIISIWKNVLAKLEQGTKNGKH